MLRVRLTVARKFCAMVLDAAGRAIELGEAKEKRVWWGLARNDCILLAQARGGRRYV
jgi:hypothetical protein